MYSLNHFVLDLWMVCFVVRQLIRGFFFFFQVVVPHFVEYETNSKHVLRKPILFHSYEREEL